MHILSFYEQDQIFNEIYSKELDDLIVAGEESLRGTEATTEQYSIEDYFLPLKWHITSSQKINDAKIEIIKFLFLSTFCDSLKDSNFKAFSKSLIDASSLFILLSFFLAIISPNIYPSKILYNIKRVETFPLSLL